MKYSIRMLALAAGLLALLLGIGAAGKARTAYSATAITLSIEPHTIRHTISEDIYGVNFATPQQAQLWRVPVSRWGGNAHSRYNWKIGVWNPGHHYYFENANDPDPGTLPYGSNSDKFVQQNQWNGMRSVVQLPLMGWVPKDRNLDCGFHVDKYGWQTDADWAYRWGCGNGISGETGEYIYWNDPYDTSVPVGVDFSREWVQHLVGQFGSAENGGVQTYALGNEPFIWHHNHHDVAKNWESFDSVTRRNIEYASAVKSVDPSADTMGPGVWGWQSYYRSAVDVENYHRNGSFPDSYAHGNMPFLAYYLQQMRIAEQQYGRRLLDYVDIHFYPQVFEGSELLALSWAGSDDAQAKRLRSTRELWDRNWQPESWVPEPIYAIPLMWDWINAYYPGTKIAISEYSFGANEHINGALAQADVLGIFGRENLHLATLWDAPAIGQPVDHAIRMYRNYDGKGGGFGNQNVPAYSSNEMAVSVFGARRYDGAVTMMVINKTKQAQSTQIYLNSSLQNAAVYRYSAGNLGTIERLGDVSGASGAVHTTLPAESITLYVFGETARGYSLNRSVNAGFVPASYQKDVSIYR